jgi:hypothetical protein
MLKIAARICVQKMNSPCWSLVSFHPLQSLLEWRLWFTIGGTGSSTQNVGERMKGYPVVFGILGSQKVCWLCAYSPQLGTRQSAIAIPRHTLYMINLTSMYFSVFHRNDY